VLSVSSRVIFPELPDASMETLKPIAFPQCGPNKLRKSSQTLAATSTQKTHQSFCAKEKGRGEIITAPHFERLSGIYSAPEVQRKPKETVGL